MLRFGKKCNYTNVQPLQKLANVRRGQRAFKHQEDQSLYFESCNPRKNREYEKFTKCPFALGRSIFPWKNREYCQKIYFFEVKNHVSNFSYSLIFSAISCIALHGSPMPLWPSWCIKSLWEKLRNFYGWKRRQRWGVTRPMTVCYAYMF